MTISLTTNFTQSRFVSLLNRHRLVFSLCVILPVGLSREEDCRPTTACVTVRISVFVSKDTLLATFPTYASKQLTTEFLNCYSLLNIAQQSGPFSVYQTEYLQNNPLSVYQREYQQRNPFSVYHSIYKAIVSLCTRESTYRAMLSLCTRSINRSSFSGYQEYQQEFFLWVPEGVSTEQSLLCIPQGVSIEDSFLSVPIFVYHREYQQWNLFSMYQRKHQLRNPLCTGGSINSGILSLCTSGSIREYQQWKPFSMYQWKYQLRNPLCTRLSINRAILSLCTRVSTEHVCICVHRLVGGGGGGGGSCVHVSIGQSVVVVMVGGCHVCMCPQASQWWWCGWSCVHRLVSGGGVT